MAEDNFAMGYALGQDSNGGSGGGSGNGWGGEGGWLWIIVVFALLFGWGGNGWGNGGGSAGGQGGADTRAAIYDGFAINGLERGVQSIQQGLCDGFYSMNSSLMSGFHGVDNAICSLGNSMQQGFNATQVAMMQGQNALSTQLANCCCENRQGQAEIKYQMATDTCVIQNTIQNTTRDIIDNQNANYRGLMEFMVNSKIEALQAENQNLKLAASQANQNSVIGAQIDAATAEILRRTGHDCPSAAYIVQPPTPVTFPTNCCGTFTGFQNGGCGCGCG